MILSKLNLFIFSLLVALFVAAYCICTTDLWEGIANIVITMLDFIASEIPHASV